MGHTESQLTSAVLAGSHDSAELSEKLDRLVRDIDNPERHAALFSKKAHRPKERDRTHDLQ